MKPRGWCLAAGALAIFAAAPIACESNTLPAPQSFNIHTTGDSVVLLGGLIRIIAPPGGISENGNVTATALSAGSVPSSPLLVNNSTFEVTISPATLRALQPITMRVNYASLSLPVGVRGTELRLNKGVSGAWQPLPGGTNDSVAATVAAATTSFGDFGLLGIPVASIVVNPLTIFLAAGATQAIAATPKDSLGTALPDRAVTYASSDTTKAKVSAAGLVTGVAVGTANITVASETRSVQIPTTVTPGAVSTSQSTVSVSAGTVVSGETVTLTLQAKDAAGNNLTTGGLTVAFTASGGTSTGTIGATTDHADGTYKAVFTAGTAGTATTVGAAVNAVAVTSSLPTLTVAPGSVSTATSTVTVSSGTTQSGTAVALTLHAKDAAGNNVTTGGATVVFTPTGGTSTGVIGSTTDHGNGIYTATFTGVGAGTATTIGATIGGTAVTTTLPTVTVTPGSASTTTSTVGVSSGTVQSGIAATLTLQAKDANGNNLITGGLAVVFTASGGTSTGTIGVTTDQANGTYTAAITAGTAGTATTVHATIGGAAVTSTLPTITVTPGGVSTTQSMVSVSAGTVASGGTVTLTLQGEDANGNNLTTGGLAVAFTASGGTSTGTIGATTDHADGTYTATFTAGTAGTATTVHATIGGAAVTSTLPTITVTAVSASECAAPQAGWIWCDDFEQNRLASYFEYDSAGGAFVRASGVGLNGSYGMRARWSTVGQVGAGSLHLAFGKTPQSYFRPVDAGTQVYRDIYWRMWVRLQPGWTGGGADKLSRATAFASTTTWAQAMAAHVWSGTSPNQDYLQLDPVSGTDPAGNLKATQFNDFANWTWLGAARSATAMFASSQAGTWFCVEAHAKLNDAGLSNGVFELWINGGTEARETGLNWLGAFSTYGINAVFFESYWNAGAPQAEERYFDNIVVSTQRIGC